jgi:hypothetical protein
MSNEEIDELLHWEKTYTFSNTADRVGWFPRNLHLGRHSRYILTGALLGTIISILTYTFYFLIGKNLTSVNLLTYFTTRIRIWSILAGTISLAWSFVNQVTRINLATRYFSDLDPCFILAADLAEYDFLEAGGTASGAKRHFEALLGHEGVEWEVQGCERRELGDEIGWYIASARPKVPIDLRVSGDTSEIFALGGILVRPGHYVHYESFGLLLCVSEGMPGMAFDSMADFRR